MQNGQEVAGRAREDVLGLWYICDRKKLGNLVLTLIMKEIAWLMEIPPPRALHSILGC